MDTNVIATEDLPFSAFDERIRNASLTHLSASNNKIASLNGFRAGLLPSLTCLCLDNNVLSNLDQLTTLSPTVQHLSIGGNPLDSRTGATEAAFNSLAVAATASREALGASAMVDRRRMRLITLPRLETLRIHDSEVTDLHKFSGCRHLQRVYAARARICSLAPSISCLTMLLVLDLSFNRLDDAGLEGLSGLHNVYSVRLRGNNIQSISTVTKLLDPARFGTIIELDLAENPLTNGFYPVTPASMTGGAEPWMGVTDADHLNWAASFSAAYRYLVSMCRADEPVRRDNTLETAVTIQSTCSLQPTIEDLDAHWSPHDESTLVERISYRALLILSLSASLACLDGLRVDESERGLAAELAGIKVSESSSAEAVAERPPTLHELAGEPESPFSGHNIVHDSKPSSQSRAQDPQLPEPHASHVPSPIRRVVAVDSPPRESSAPPDQAASANVPTFAETHSGAEPLSAALQQTRRAISLGKPANKGAKATRSNAVPAQAQRSKQLVTHKPSIYAVPKPVKRTSSAPGHLRKEQPHGTSSVLMQTARNAGSSVRRDSTSSATLRNTRSEASVANSRMSRPLKPVVNPEHAATTEGFRTFLREARAAASRSQVVPQVTVLAKTPPPQPTSSTHHPDTPVIPVSARSHSTPAATNRNDEASSAAQPASRTPGLPDRSLRDELLLRSSSGRRRSINGAADMEPIAHSGRRHSTSAVEPADPSGKLASYSARRNSALVCSQTYTSIPYIAGPSTPRSGRRASPLRERELDSSQVAAALRNLDSVNQIDLSESTCTTDRTNRTDREAAIGIAESPDLANLSQTAVTASSLQPRATRPTAALAVVQQSPLSNTAAATARDPVDAAAPSPAATRLAASSNMTVAGSPSSPIPPLEHSRGYAKSKPELGMLSPVDAALTLPYAASFPGDDDRFVSEATRAFTPKSRPADMPYFPRTTPSRRDPDLQGFSARSAYAPMIIVTPPSGLRRDSMERLSSAKTRSKSPATPRSQRQVRFQRMPRSLRARSEELAQEELFQEPSSPPGSFWERFGSTPTSSGHQQATSRGRSPSKRVFSPFWLNKRLEQQDFEAVGMEHEPVPVFMVSSHTNGSGVQGRLAVPHTADMGRTPAEELARARTTSTPTLSGADARAHGRASQSRNPPTYLSTAFKGEILHAVASKPVERTVDFGHSPAATRSSGQTLQADNASSLHAAHGLVVQHTAEFGRSPSAKAVYGTAASQLLQGDDGTAEPPSYPSSRPASASRADTLQAKSAPSLSVQHTAAYGRTPSKNAINPNHDLARSTEGGHRSAGRVATPVSTAPLMSSAVHTQAHQSDKLHAGSALTVEHTTGYTHQSAVQSPPAHSHSQLFGHSPADVSPAAERFPSTLYGGSPATQRNLAVQRATTIEHAPRNTEMPSRSYSAHAYGEAERHTLRPLEFQHMASFTQVPQAFQSGDVAQIRTRLGMSPPLREPRGAESEQHASLAVQHTAAFGQSPALAGVSADSRAIPQLINTIAGHMSRGPHRLVDEFTESSIMDSSMAELLPRSPLDEDASIIETDHLQTHATVNAFAHPSSQMSDYRVPTKPVQGRHSQEGLSTLGDSQANAPFAVSVRAGRLVNGAAGSFRLAPSAPPPAQPAVHAEAQGHTLLSPEHVRSNSGFSAHARPTNTMQHLVSFHRGQGLDFGSSMQQQSTSVQPGRVSDHTEHDLSHPVSSYGETAPDAPSSQILYNRAASRARGELWSVSAVRADYRQPIPLSQSATSLAVANSQQHVLSAQRSNGLALARFREQMFSQTTQPVLPQRELRAEPAAHKVVGLDPPNLAVGMTAAPSGSMTAATIRQQLAAAQGLPAEASTLEHSSAEATRPSEQPMRTKSASLTTMHLSSHSASVSPAAPASQPTPKRAAAEDDEAKPRRNLRRDLIASATPSPERSESSSRASSRRVRPQPWQSSERSPSPSMRIAKGGVSFSAGAPADNGPVTISFQQPGGQNAGEAFSIQLEGAGNQTLSSGFRAGSPATVDVGSLLGYQGESNNGVSISVGGANINLGKTISVTPSVASPSWDQGSGQMKLTVNGTPVTVLPSVIDPLIAERIKLARKLGGAVAQPHSAPQRTSSDMTLNLSSDGSRMTIGRLQQTRNSLEETVALAATRVSPVKTPKLRQPGRSFNVSGTAHEEVYTSPVAAGLISGHSAKDRPMVRAHFHGEGQITSNCDACNHVFQASKVTSTTQGRPASVSKSSQKPAFFAGGTQQHDTTPNVRLKASQQMHVARLTKPRTLSSSLSHSTIMRASDNRMYNVEFAESTGAGTFAEAASIPHNSGTAIIASDAAENRGLPVASAVRAAYHFSKVAAAHAAPPKIADPAYEAAMQAESLRNVQGKLVQSAREDRHVNIVLSPQGPKSHTITLSRAEQRADEEVTAAVTRHEPVQRPAPVTTVRPERKAQMMAEIQNKMDRILQDIDVSLTKLGTTGK
jgi:hypothetical protein